MPTDEALKAHLDRHEAAHRDALDHHHHHHHHHHDGHAHRHSHAGPGHNLPHPDHLHSHIDPADKAADLQVLTEQFIESFRNAGDKIAFLDLAKIPREIADPDGGPSLKLVDVRITTEWQVATAGPSFGSRELSYLAYTGGMVKERTNMGLVYVSLERKRIVDIRDCLGDDRQR